jgi:acyl-CoA hydrolase
MVSDGLLALLEQGVVKREICDGAGRRCRVVDGAFFLGSRDFYRRLRELDEALLERINMTSVNKVNGLYGGEELRRAQRRDARFLNSVMEATALGGAASDALGDGRIVSGVGGQYNFVAMGHELEGGRGILLVRSTKMRGGHLHSNIVWERPNETIPRHLKDIVVSEYGIADLRGQTDGETIKRMLAICDSRFQEALLDQARRARKIERSYRIPDAQRANTPERLSAVLGQAKRSGLLPPFPFGTDLTETEIVLAEALRHLKAQTASPRALFRFARSVLRAAHAPESATPYLERLGLAHAGSLKERALQRLVVAALSQTGALA